MGTSSVSIRVTGPIGRTSCAPAKCCGNWASWRNSATSVTLILGAGNTASMSGTCARSQPPQSNWGTGMSDSQDEKLEKAAGWLREADGLLITAGAGMGVDSGLPDFRGRDGFWRAYP